MMRFILAALTCITTLLIADTHSSAFPAHGGGAISVCGGDTYSATDGCLGAPVGGDIQIANLYTSYGLQSGQTYTARPPWYAAGVDYPVGISAASFPLKDPTIASVPVGCVYTSSPSRLTCTNAAAPTFDGFDFLNTAQGCVRLLFQGSSTGPIILSNTRFKNGTKCDIAGSDLINIGVGVTSDVLFWGSTLDGDGINSPYNLIALVENNTTGCTTIRYSAFFRSSGRNIDLNSTCGLDAKYSYAEGWMYALKTATNGSTVSGNAVLHFAAVPAYVANGMQVNDATTPASLVTVSHVSSFTGTTVTLDTPTTGAGVANGDQIAFSSNVHGEFALTDTQSGTSGTAALMTLSYMTYVQPTSANGLETTSFISLSNGTNLTKFTTINVDHSSFISNRIYSTRNLVGYTIAYQGTIGTLNFTSNYFDPTGAFGCFTQQAGTVGTTNYTSNVNLLDSSVVNATTCNGHN
jgi:hypothetical protein